jgi:hypothetical protein
MYVRFNHAKPRWTSKPARVAVAPGQTIMGADQVTVVISAIDAYDMPSIVATLSLSVDEAQRLTEQLVATLNKEVR